jgi:TfoX/Sxy family transcriptional regulator of competence genes
LIRSGNELSHCVEERVVTTDELFHSVVEEMACDPHVVKAKMFGSPGLKVTNKVFAMLVKGKLVVKLPRARVESLIASGQGEYFDPGHGRLMKEWVAIKPSRRDEWLSLIDEAKAFVESPR